MIKQTKGEIKKHLTQVMQNLELTKNDVCGVYDFKNTDWLISEAYDLGIIEAEDYAIATKHFYNISETITLDYDIKLRHIETFDMLIDLGYRLLKQSQEIADKLNIRK